MARAYDTADIQVLDYPENIQRRPGMYVGGTGLDALHHLAYELIDNAVDEALAGACSRIQVEILPDGSLKVIDDGRGIPVDIHPKMGKPAASADVQKSGRSSLLLRSKTAPETASHDSPPFTGWASNTS